MSLGTIDRSPPPFFRQGPSALSKLLVFGALSLLLMVADARFRITQPIRAALVTVLYPMQWLALQPVQAVKSAGDYFIRLNQAESNSEAASRKLALQSLRAGQVEQLTLENNRLRKLLGLREQLATSVMTAEVLYDAADPYTRKVI
ncbi:MAG: rod shape-determining protein MreC, partial [Polaromonas sp.]